MPQPDITVVGGAVVDYIAAPQPGSDLTLGSSSPGEVRQSFGGVGRNVAHGIANLLQGFSRQHLRRGASAGEHAPMVSLVSAVGSDSAGRALVKACREAGISSQEIVEVAPAESGKSDPSRTASYSAILDGRGDLMAGVADMQVLDSMSVVRAMVFREKTTCCLCK